MVGVSSTSRSSSVSTFAGRKICWAADQARKLAYFGDVPASEFSETVQELREGTSKYKMYIWNICYSRLSNFVIFFVVRFCLYIYVVSLF